MTKLTVESQLPFVICGPSLHLTDSILFHSITSTVKALKWISGVIHVLTFTSQIEGSPLVTSKRPRVISTGADGTSRDWTSSLCFAAEIRGEGVWLIDRLEEEMPLTEEEGD